MLWFAFNFWSYDLWIQLMHCWRCADNSCDLLSISDLTIFEYNPWPPGCSCPAVVICFQFLILRSLNTTPFTNPSLWTGCDLLSISDLTIFEYNGWLNTIHDKIVVICFQFLILRSLNTTNALLNYDILMLWFAFNFWSYDLWIQHQSHSYTPCAVVICFQFLILRSLNTTFCNRSGLPAWLWFAFNFWSYDLWIQQVFTGAYQIIGCDLLSISDLTIFEYNFDRSSLLG